MSGTVDTKESERRELTFPSIDEAVAEAERLANGPTRTTGNQSAGQLVEHLAKSIDANVAGVKAKFPLPVRAVLAVARPLLGGVLKRSATRNPMPAGMTLPKVLRPEFASEGGLPIDEAVAAYRQAVARLKAADAIPTHPVFGEMTTAECEQLHCRHAELHLSFIHRDEA